MYQFLIIAYLFTLLIFNLSNSFSIYSRSLGPSLAMAESPIPAPDTNGIPMDDDEFEKNLKEILEDGPNLNDMSNTVQGGTPQKGLSQSTYSLSTSSSGYQAPPQALSRSQTMPGGKRFCT